MYCICNPTCLYCLVCKGQTSVKSNNNKEKLYRSIYRRTLNISLEISNYLLFLLFQIYQAMMDDVIEPRYHPLLDREEDEEAQPEEEGQAENSQEEEADAETAAEEDEEAQPEEEGQAENRQEEAAEAETASEEEEDGDIQVIILAFKNYLGNSSEILQSSVKIWTHHLVQA